MGETGVATSPDVNSVHWNNVKLAFIDKKYGFGMSYVPWLGKIVDDMSVSYLTGFYKLDNVQTIGLSMKYFDKTFIKPAKQINLILFFFKSFKISFSIFIFLKFKTFFLILNFFA